MNILCNKVELIEAVGNVQRAVSAKASLPALEGILLRAQGNTLYLAGFDMELGISTTIPAAEANRIAARLSDLLYNPVSLLLPT